MEEGPPSPTAIGAAVMRAAHLLLDDDPKILDDHLALGLSGAGNEAILQSHLNTFQAEMTARSSAAFAQTSLKYLRSITTVRNRYAEDELAKAIQRGISQYVILGAGLDSFAYRRRDLTGVLQVFEVDHPDTQQWKRARLKALRVDLPANLTFVPIDFEKQPLIETLREGGYRLEEPGFFSWLGVTQYLTEDAIFKILTEVASLAPGTELIFLYIVQETIPDTEERRILVALKAASASRGEPWLSLFDPASLAARVQKLGFTEVVDFGPEEANTRYFAGRTDGLRVLNIAHLMKARVGGTC